MSDYFKAELEAHLSAIANAIDAQTPSENAVARLMRAAEADDAALGATAREILPLLVMGLVELGKSFATALDKRGRGRPKKENLFADMDCRRACLCWNAVRRIGKPDMTNRTAIRLARMLEALADIPPEEAAFPKHVTDETLEQSISRGKKKLGFSAPWTCKTCEGNFLGF